MIMAETLFSCYFLQRTVQQCMIRGNRRLLFVLVMIVFSIGFYFSILRNSHHELTIEAQYKLSDVREYHIYNRHLLKPHPSIHLINTRHSRYKDKISIVKPFDPVLHVIYVVTPTYTRWVQMAELMNMCTAMKHVQNILWILIEDSVNKTKPVTDFLIKCEIPTVHMNFKSYFKPYHTVDQRNAALRWIRENVDVKAGKGVVYYADDDNTYDPDVFDEMRSTKVVSVWPVGLGGLTFAEIPVVIDGKIQDWVSYFDVKERRYPIDMAGIAINVKVLYNNTKVRFRHDIPTGHLETAYLESLDVPMEEFELKADNCTKVLVWHTRRERYKPNPVSKTKYGRPLPKQIGYV